MSRDALIVGISSYQYLPGLNTPAHDGEAIAQRLQTDGNFRVTRLPEIVQSGQLQVGIKTQVTLAELEAALVRLFKPRGTTIPQTALFYFSGHGLQKDIGIQEGYLATSEANPSTGLFGLSLFWLRRLLQESPVRQRVILLDCCHSGELLNFLEADPGARSGTDRLFMAASREYEAAYESITGHYSIFTQAVLAGLDPHRLPNGIVSNYGLTDWVSNALKAEQQQPLFENSGSEIILTRSQGCPTILKTELKQEICPYRGLECFEEADAEFFFGREDLTDQLLEKVRSQNFVAVLGASGSGKSSLVRAGLIYRLRQGQQFSGSDRWRIQLLTPTDQPLKSLAMAFVNGKAPMIDRAEHLQRAEMLLRESEQGLAHLVNASLLSAKQGRNQRLLLIIDQFEEVFTLGHGEQADRDRHRFFNLLLVALQEVGDRLSLVIVLRADFFSKCSLYKGLAEKIEENLVTVTPLTYEQIKASILKPAEKVGLMCEPNLVYNILLDIVGAPGELPLLEYTLLELWQRRQPDPNGGPSRLTLDAYTHLGGVRGTLQKRADEIFYSLTMEEQQVAKRIFIALTQIGDGTEDTRRRVLKSELISPRLPVELVDRVLEKLVRAKLIVMNQIVNHNYYQERVDQGLANVSTALRFAQMVQGKMPRRHATQPSSLGSHLKHPAHSGGTVPITDVTKRTCRHLHEIPGCHETVDVAHETLIRHWSLLRSWLDDNRDMLRRQRQIEHAAREWDNLGQPHGGEYLLRGNRLVEAEEFLSNYPTELSAHAQYYIAISQEESHRSQKELRLVQLAVPCTLLVALAVTFNQYWMAVKNQTEKDYQLQIATSRQQAAIAQSILQESDGDPATALLISRLAAEKGGGTYEAQTSLRAALQKLRLQTVLNGHQGAVSQLRFSPDRRHLATAGDDGTIRLWSLEQQRVVRVWHWLGEKGKTRSDPHQASAAMPASPHAAIVAIAFSPDGKQVAAIARGFSQVQIWSVESGALQFQLTGFSQPAVRLAFTAGRIAAASADNQIRIWQTETGALQSQFSQPHTMIHLEFSPDGQWLLTTGGNTVRLWQSRTGKLSKMLLHQHTVNHATFSPDQKTIATASEEGTVRLWDLPTGKVRYALTSSPPKGQTQDGHSTKAAIRQVVFSPDGRLLASIDRQYRVQLWQVWSGSLWTQASLPQSAASGYTGQPLLSFSPDSRYLLTTGQAAIAGDSGYGVRLLDVHSGQIVGTLRGHTGVVEAAQFSLDGTLIATADADGLTRLWSADTGSEYPTLKITGKQIEWASLETGVLAIASDGTLNHWNQFQTPPAQLSSPGGTTGAIASSSPEPESGSNQLSFLKRIRLYAGFLKPPPPQASPSPAAPSVIPREPEELAANSIIAMPPPAAGRNPALLSQQLAPGRILTAVGIGLKSRLLATADSSGSLTLWKLQADWSVKRIHSLATASPNPTQSPPSRSLVIRHLAFSQDRQWLLGVGEDRVVYIWEVASGRLKQRLQGHGQTIQIAEFSPDGQQVISASRDRTLRRWQVSSGQQTTLIQMRSIVNSVHFSPDGQLIVVTAQDGTARVLDPRTQSLQVLLAGHRGAILDADFSPDGQTLVTASADGTARLWDAHTGVETALLRPMTADGTIQPLKQAFFSPDGQYILTLSQQGTVYIWAASWQHLLALARDRSLTQLKPSECLRYLRLPPNVCPILEARR